MAVRKAATERVFGFEIMPAPFVVAHLQVGLTMQNLDAPLAADGSERAGVFLTNALTGWEPHMNKPLPFPELEEDRDRADRVKQDTPILVILGNPPYNGFAGMAVDEERELSEAYRTTRRVRRPEGQGLNDLYVRFFRMAERRIAERTGQGVVCFISNYSWLDGLSFLRVRSALRSPDRTGSCRSAAVAKRMASPGSMAGMGASCSSHKLDTCWTGGMLSAKGIKRSQTAAPYVRCSPPLRSMYGSAGSRPHSWSSASKSAAASGRRSDAASLQNASLSTRRRIGTHGPGNDHPHELSVAHGSALDVNELPEVLREDSRGSG